MNELLEGTSCNLLQPDGKGWQKGKLRLCFEFTPGENENLTRIQVSPLDEIRQLAKEPTSATLIEHN